MAMFKFKNTSAACVRAKKEESHHREELKNAMAKTETVEHGVIVDNWMHLVASTVEPLIDVLPEEIVKKGGRPWEL